MFTLLDGPSSTVTAITLGAGLAGDHTDELELGAAASDPPPPPHAASKAIKTHDRKAEIKRIFLPYRTVSGLTPCGRASGK